MLMLFRGASSGVRVKAAALKQVGRYGIGIGQIQGLYRLRCLQAPRGRRRIKRRDEDAHIDR